MNPSPETENMTKRTNEVCNRLPSLLYSIFALPPVQMCPRMRSTEVGGPVGQHAVQHTRIQRCCGLHVQIRRYSLELYAIRFDRLGTWKRTNGCHPSRACGHAARSPCFNGAAVQLKAYTCRLCGTRARALRHSSCEEIMFCCAALNHPQLLVFLRYCVGCDHTHLPM